MDEDLATNPSVPPDESDRAEVAALTSRSRSGWPTRPSTTEDAEQRVGAPAGGQRRAPMGARGPSGPAADRGGGAARRPPVRSAGVEEAAVRAAAIAVPRSARGRRRSRCRRRAGCRGGARRGEPGWDGSSRSRLAPLAAVGLVANAVGPWSRVHAAGRRPAPPVRHATIKFLTAIVVVPRRTGPLLRWWVFADAAAHPWLLTLAVGPVCGLAALWCVGRVLRARRARLGLRRLAACDRPRGGPPRPPRPPRGGRPTLRTGPIGDGRPSGPDGAGSLDVRP